MSPGSQPGICPRPIPDSSRPDGRLRPSRQDLTSRTAEVVADNVYFADSKSERSDNSSKGAPAAEPNPYGAYGAPPVSNPYGAYTPPASDFAMLEDDDAQLPF